tara:strand:+ start:340 stop:771 length:432 start_codon:yes stop_codon:yes gene_type:complete
LSSSFLSPFFYRHFFIVIFCRHFSLSSPSSIFSLGVEINERKQELPGLLARVRPAFQAMIDEGMSNKDMFLKFDEDDGGGVDEDEFREGFIGLGVEFTDKEFGWIIGIWMGKEEELEFPAFEAVVKKTLAGHSFPLPPLPWSP